MFTEVQVSSIETVIVTQILEPAYVALKLDYSEVIP